jgi:hypothetical protein
MGQSGGDVLRHPSNSEITNRTRNTTKSSRAISVAAAAMPPKPNTAAMMATTRKRMDQRSTRTPPSTKMREGHPLPGNTPFSTAIANRRPPPLTLTPNAMHTFLHTAWKRMRRAKTQRTARRHCPRFSGCTLVISRGMDDCRVPPSTDGRTRSVLHHGGRTEPTFGMKCFVEPRWTLSFPCMTPANRSGVTET